VAPTRKTQEAEDFLKGKGICVHQEDHTYIKLYGYGGSPFLLPTFVCDRYFVAEVYRRYKTWSIILDKKRKKQIISLPFNLSNTTVRSSTHLIKVFEKINAFNLKKEEPLRGFYLEGLFSEHLTSMTYNNLFTMIVEGIDDNDINTPKKKEKHICNDDLVTKVSSNTQRKQNKTRQRGKDATNVQSSSAPHTRRSSSSTQKKQESNISKEENNEGRVGGDDEDNPPHSNIERTHAVS
jgi:hypothetical protein